MKEHSSGFPWLGLDIGFELYLKPFVGEYVEIENVVGHFADSPISAFLKVSNGATKGMKYFQEGIALAITPEWYQRGMSWLTSYVDPCVFVNGP